MNVYCYPVDRNGTYVPLLFEGIEDEFHRVYRQDGSLQDAIAELDAGRAVIVHVHWEEFVLRDCRSEGDADAAAAGFVREIVALRERNAPIVWTVHNEWPHEIPYRRQFLAMRKILVRYADAILLHNEASHDILAAQFPTNGARVHRLPHPSYLGRYEDEAALASGLRERPERRIQAFGWIRLQKGYARLIELLPAAYLESREATLRISGRGIETAAVIAQQTARSDVRWDVRYVPDGEIPQLLRSAACVVLPYERVLTSGVALLAMSVGALVVAVDRPQFRELFPSESHRFLYARDDAEALRGIIDGIFALTARERRAIVDANLAVARDVHPRSIARRLAALYRTISNEKKRRPASEPPFNRIAANYGEPC